MIYLKKESYCENCAEFEPCTKRINIFGNEGCLVNTTVYCKHKDRCKAQMKYLHTQVSEKSGNMISNEKEE